MLIRRTWMGGPAFAYLGRDMRDLVSSIMRTVLVAALCLSLMTVGACGGSGGYGQPCPRSACPATSVTTVVEVTNISPTAASGAQAALTGPVTDSMFCQSYGDTALCTWSGGIPVTAGTYTLQVSAPGYRTATVQVEVTVSPPVCGNCTAGSIQPSTVTLSPADAGTD
jgi:hypothetical protein